MMSVPSLLFTAGRGILTIMMLVMVGRASSICLDLVGHRPIFLDRITLER